MKLSTKTRNNLPLSAFARPSDRGFPFKKMENGHLVLDRSHARAAISGATRAEHAGNMSVSEGDSIQARMRKALGKARTAHAKKHNPGIRF